MALQAPHGLRGSQLESMINETNELYRIHRLGLVQKIPTPITPIKIDAHHHISLAYFDSKSTVDYIGVIQGVPVCFDAKESGGDTYALSNIHEHQFMFMKEFEEQGGIAFILLRYTKKEVSYYLRFSDLRNFWERAEGGGRKSFRFDELDMKWMIREGGKVPVDYITAVSMDFEERAFHDGFS